MYRNNSSSIVKRIVAVLIIATISAVAVVDALQGSSVRLDGGPLPEDYVAYPGYYNVAYKYHREALYWEEAQEECKSEGGNLAVADSVDKIMLLRSIQTKENGSLHVGIQKLETTEDWVRVDNNVSLTSLPWSADSRGQDSDLRCAAARFQGLRMFLIRVPCDEDGRSSEFFCEVKTSFVRREQVPIPEGYRQSSIYNVAIKYHTGHSYQRPWNEAQQKCESEGADLLIAKTQDEINLFESDLPSYELDDLYIGIRRSNASEDWYRVDNDQKQTYVSSLPKFRDTIYDCTRMGKVNGKISLIPINCDVHSFAYLREAQRDRFICKVTTITVFPEGYVILPDSEVAHKLHGDIVTHNEARVRCNREGANLATSRTLKNIDRIRSLQLNYKSPLHVGEEHLL